jgi:site-specific DNA recombinase
MSTNAKAVLYARVSTKEQAEEGYSIEAQIKLLREYAKDRGIEIAREFTDAESAKSAGRTQFNEMQRFLKMATTVKTILCEKTDRLYRNFHDYIALDIDQSDVTVIFVKEGTTLNKDSRSHEKLVHGLKVLLAKNYIDNLKEETAKGMLEKAEQGEFPQLAPIGYRNNKGTHRIDVDRERAPLIRRMFELYASGNYSLQSLQHKITEEGLRSKGGRKLQKSEVAYVLNSPMYYGDFRWHGKIYRGIHEPVITKGLFQAAQAVMKRYNVVRTTKMDFAFRGLLTCGLCGTAFTAERKKGRYVYYHCSFSKTRCKNNYFREEVLDERLGAIIKAIQIDADVLNQLTAGLKESHSQEKVYHEQAITSLHQTYQRIQEKLDRAYNDKLEGVITEEFWAEKSQGWRKEQEEVRESIAKHESANQSYFDTGIQLLTLASRAYDLYQVRSLPEKRQLLNFVVSNLRVEGETLHPIYKKPFDLLAKGLERPNWLPD